ncbi:hypothetical protein Tco_0179357 [Tanacetum coccineum]
MSDLKFADTHNLVAFLEKPTKSEGFEEIVDFLNANPIKYALTVNPTIYCSCVKQFWDTVKAKMVNGEVQLQALVDKKKVIITESTIRRDLQLEDANGVDCLPTAAIFKQLTLMGAKTTAWNEFSSTMASAIICLATNKKFNFSKYIFDNMVKNVDIQAHEEMGKGSEIPTNPHHTPIIQPSTSQPQKKQSRRKQRKDTEIPQSSGLTEHIADEVANEENVPTQSNDPPLSRVNTLGSGEDRLSLKELTDLCTKLSNRVLDLETTKTAQANEIASLKKRVKKLERKRKSKTSGMKRLFKIGRENSGGVLILMLMQSVTLMMRLKEWNDDQPKCLNTSVLDEQKLRLEERIAREKEEANTALIVQWNDIQDKVETNYELAQTLQAEEQEELTIEEKSKLFQQLLEKRRSHLQLTRAEERRKVNTFVDMDTELVEGSEIRKEESSSKRAGDELEQEPTKKAKWWDDDKKRGSLSTMLL